MRPFPRSVGVALVAARAVAPAPAAAAEREWPEEVPRVAWWEWAGSAVLLGGTGQHYLTDNLLGLGVGAGSALVPHFLHYFRRDPSRTSDRGWLRPTGVMLAPVGAGGAVLQATGLW